MKKRILIMSAGAGTGHIKAAEALEKSLAFGATTSRRASQFSFFDSIRVGKKQIT
jgi:hypothetical protein